MTDIFGDIKDADQLEHAVLDTLQYWFPTYLREIEIQRGMNSGDLQMPLAWITVNELDKFPEDQIPAVIVVSPGLVDDPVHEGDGTYTGAYGVGVAIVCMAANKADVRMLTKRYTSAIRAVLVQKASLRGFAEGTLWTDETYDDLPVEDERTLGLGRVEFTVWVRGVIQKFAGPIEPADPEEQPGSQWPLVATHDETIEAMP